jgi:hypothetical protein
MITAKQFDEALTGAGAWDTLDFEKGQTFFLPKFDLNAAVHDSFKETDYNSWADEETTSAWVVFQIDGRLFRKAGYSDSWSGQTWDSTLNEVAAKTVEQIVYEPSVAPEIDGTLVMRAIEGETRSELANMTVGSDPLTVFGLGTVKLLSRWGDRDGDGEQVSRVFTVGGKIFRWDGYYSSWEGVELNGKPYEVVGTPVTEIRYERP